MTDMMQDDVTLNLGGNKVSLFALAGELNFSEVKEVRFTAFPRGMFDFEVKEFTYGPVEKTLEDGTKENNLLIQVKCECLTPHAVEQEKGKEQIDPTTLVGKMHQEGFFVKDEDGFGRFKAFLVDIGVDFNCTLSQMAERVVGTRFTGQITHRKNPKDADRPYVGFGKLAPLKA